jgi:hypothetical protein
MNHSVRVMHRPRRAWPSAARTTAAIIATAPLVLMAGACGGSPSSSGPGGSSNAARPASSRSTSVPPALAFARCVRSHGDPNWPDPNSSGEEPPSAKQEAVGNPRFPAAARACVHLLPNGGQETQAQILADQRDAVRFAGCMRTHGVPSWPDATNDPRGRPVFSPQAAGIDLNSPRVMAAEQRCQSLLRLAQLPRGA